MISHRNIQYKNVVILGVGFWNKLGSKFLGEIAALRVPLNESVEADSDLVSGEISKSILTKME